MKPVIGIPLRSIGTSAWLPPSQGLHDVYIDVISEFGGIPLPIPLVADASLLDTYIDMIDGLWLAGGGDVHPSLYHEIDRFATDLDNRQDTNEFKLVNWAIRERVPIIGMCRGIQVINVALGGTLYQDLYEELPSDINHNASYEKKDLSLQVHDLAIVPDSRVGRVTGITQCQVNSLHHQGIRTLGTGLRAVGTAPDGLIEIIEGTEHPYILMTQFHPEMLADTKAERWNPLFADYIAACSTARSKSKS